MRSKDGVSRGFGFVTFDDDVAASRAVERNPHFVRDRKIEVKKAVPKGQGEAHSIWQLR